MKRDELLGQLEMWHEEDRFQEIVDNIEEIPQKDRDYVLNSHLSRAFNNLGRYDEAVELLLTIREEGKNDPLWHYRIGMAYYYLERYEEAREAFLEADRLEPGDEDTLEFLVWIDEQLGTSSDDAEDLQADELEGASSEKDKHEEQEREVEEKGVKAAAVDAATSARFQAIVADPSSFWDDSNQAMEYSSSPPTEELIESVQEELVFKLPQSYIELMRQHNGGIPVNRYFPLVECEVMGNKYVEISGIYGIGREKAKSLCGSEGSRYVIESGGYPEIGVVVCDCPDQLGVVMLDYRESGNDGDPEVVFVKQEGAEIVRLAASFDEFVAGLSSSAS